MLCAACGSENPSGQKFCNGCGQALTADPAPALPATPDHLAQKIRAGRGALEGERKQVTVLFADVAGSMELAERSDAEAWQLIMERFFTILCAGVHRFEGTVDKFTGDGIMALFGAPIGHEDHAQRACYAALHLQRELAAYAADLRRNDGLNLSVRMGLNSGEVVVGAIGEDLAMAYTAVGHTVGLAQRMEQLAAADRVYLSEHTGALVDGHFALSDLGEFHVKGASGPVRVHELTGVGTARGRLDVSRARGFSRFVGRDDELHTLEQAFSGEGHVIGIVGEAGVGKSRLCHEFAERCRAKGIPVYHLAGQAHAKEVPLLPVLQLLREFFEISERDADRTARERIAGKLLLLDESFADDLPLMFDFLAVPDPERPSPPMDPEGRQRRLLELIKRLSHAESARQPSVTVFEDLHWLDPVSEVYLANHVEAIQGTHGLTVLNFRPEYQAGWMSRSFYRQIALEPLAAEATEEMLRYALGPDPSLDGLPELIRERTQGNPFFIEELVRALVEAGNLEGEQGSYRLVKPVDEVAVPPTVQAILAARIDRLGARDKAVVQAAAVVGKEFSAAVLEQAAELTPAELEDALRNLVASEFVYEQELFPEALYAFKHPLTQEVAYRSQLADRRAPVHAAVARAIAARYPERLEERAALLAQHWEAARDAPEAARWHARAAVWAGTSAPSQALIHWGKVRELTDSMSESDETASLGLTARIALLDYGWRLGILHDEAEALFNEAERMASSVQSLHLRAFLLLSYGVVVATTDGDLREYARRSRQAVALAEESGDPALYVSVAITTYALFCTGALQEGLAICNRAIELADGDPTVGAGMAGGSGDAWCHAQKGGFLITLGELDEADRALQQGRRIAREQGNIEVVGFCHQWSTLLAYYRGDPEAARGHAEQALEVAERTGSGFSRTWSWSFLGWAHSALGEWKQAIAAIERSMAIAKERRTAIEGTGLRLMILGESHLGLGDAGRALELVREGLALAVAQGAIFNEIYGNRALARALLASAGPAARVEIEAALARALELVHESGARVDEPLVHVELAELARRLGDSEGHQRELTEAHRLFTEMGATGHAERLSAELAAAPSQA